MGKIYANLKTGQEPNSVCILYNIAMLLLLEAVELNLRVNELHKTFLSYKGQ